MSAWARWGFLGPWHFPVSVGTLGFSRALALPCQHGHTGVFWGLGTSLSAWASWGFLGPWHFPAGVGKLGFSRALASPMGQICYGMASRRLWSSLLKSVFESHESMATSAATLTKSLTLQSGHVWLCMQNVLSQPFSTLRFVKSELTQLCPRLKFKAKKKKKFYLLLHRF